MATAIEASPAGRLARMKSGTLYESPEVHESKMLDFREAARAEAFRTQRMHREASKIHEYIDFLEGRHWPQTRKPWRSSLYVNRMAKARLDVLSMLTDIKPTLDVTPNYTILPGIEQQAEIAKLVIQSEWVKRAMLLALIEVVDHAMLATGFWKVGAVMPGKLLVSACGFDNVLPIQPGARLQDASGVLYRAYRPLSYFYRIWGKRAEGLEKYAVQARVDRVGTAFRRPPHIDEISWKNASPQMRYKLAVADGMSEEPGSTYFPVIPLEEYWIEDYNTNTSKSNVVVKDPHKPLDEHNWHYTVAPGERLFPRKRLIIFAGDRLMYDGPSPYWHGLYPFAQLNLNPVVWGYGSLSRYRDLVPLNKAINEIIAGIHELIRRALNPQLITREGAIAKAAWRNFFQDRPGDKLIMNKMANPNQDLRYANPPQIPSYVYTMLMQYLVPEFEKMAGFLDIAALTKKNQIPGGDTIEQMKDAMQTQLRLESRFIEQFLIDAGQLALSNVFQFFTAKQRLKILGPDGVTYQDYDFDPDNMKPWTEPKEEHWKNFSLTVAEGSLHGASRDREKQMAIALFKGGVISRRELLRKLGWGNIEAIERELEEESQMLAAQMAGAKGMPRMTRGQRNGQAV